MTAMRLKHSHIIAMEVRDDEALARLSQNYMDPDTGKVYNVLLDVMKDDVKRKLVKVEHTKESIKNGFQMW